MVAEFWEAFDFLDDDYDQYGNRTPVLNHSREPTEIAVNLNEFVEKAANARQQIPPLTDLKRHLKTSKHRKFIESSRVVSSAITYRATRCWIFKRSRAEIRAMQDK